MAVISIEVVRGSVFKDHAAQWSGIEHEKQRTQNGPLRDSKFEIGFGGQSPILILWHLPVKYDLSQLSAFPVTPNQSSSLLSRIV